MKFENPIMNISMFEVESIVTDGSEVVQPKSAASKAMTALTGEGGAGVAAGNVLEFTF